MISIGKLTSVDQAVTYLREALADHQLSYYTVQGESPGRWSGRGAEALGLRGEVTDADFRAVLTGTHPRTGADLGRHWQSQVVVAFDIAVSAPKDVSILYALGDERTRASILRIHHDGVRAASEYLQLQAGWARLYNPETHRAEPVRAALVMPQFLHRTARPVTDPVTGAVTVDPQLHTHITVPNWALRPDGSWGQLYSEPLYQHAAAAGAIAQAVWRDGMVRELGISTVVDGRGCFSIVGITEEQRRAFSRRRLQIEAAEHELGYDSRRSREVATLDTRQSKSCVPASTDLFAQWRQRAASVGLDATTYPTLFNREAAAMLERQLDVSSAADILGARGLTAQSATFSRRDVIRAVASHAPLGMQRMQLEAVVDAILADRGAVVPLLPHPRPGETEVQTLWRWTESGREVRYTTPEMLELEQRMLRTALERAEANVGVATAQHVAAAIDTRPTLTDEQRQMIQLVCASPAGVIIVEGAAGVGKTYALEVARDAWRASRVDVVGCALAGRAAEELEQGSAIPSSTVQSLLNYLEVQHLPEGGVLVVDEAGMLGDRQLAQLTELAARDNAKLVLVGDPYQLQAIEAGAPFRSLAEHIGRVVMTENVRQVALWERAALDLVRNARAEAAYTQYELHGRIHREATAPERIQAMVADQQRLASQGVDAVMLARRRDDVTQLNELARAAAVRDGRVGGPTLVVDGRPYAQGDKVLCLANDRSGALSNGTRGTVTLVDTRAGTMFLKRPDGTELLIDTRRYDAIDRGYALTVHKAQGMTAQVALVMGSDSASREWTYTALSRGSLATHYYEVQRPAERDALGVHHGEESAREAGDRTIEAWQRIEQKDSAIDYPARYADVEPSSEQALAREPTDAQRDLLAHLGAPELDADATWIDASLEIDRCLGHAPGSRLSTWLHHMGYSDVTIKDLLQQALRAGDLTPGAMHSEDCIVGRTVNGILTLAGRQLFQTAEMGSEPSHGPDMSPW